jgi:hypothetical protein
VKNQPPALEVDDAIAEGEKFVETQIVGPHGRFIMKRPISLFNARVTPQTTAFHGTRRTD